MKKKEISPTEWLNFCDTFSKIHQDWLVTVEETDQNKKSRVISEGLSLLAIEPDLKVGRKNLLIILKAREKDFIHTVEAVNKVVLEEYEQNIDKQLNIISDNGKVTFVIFRIAALPETIDGVLNY